MMIKGKIAPRKGQRILQSQYESLGKELTVLADPNDETMLTNPYIDETRKVRKGFYFAIEARDAQEVYQAISRAGLVLKESKIERSVA